jgi:hypothetical protein
MDAYYVKVGDQFYAEHADGSAFLTSSYLSAVRFHSRQAAALVAAGIVGAKAYRPRIEQAVERLLGAR